MQSIKAIRHSILALWGVLLTLFTSCEENNEHFITSTGTISPEIIVDPTLSEGTDVAFLGYDIPEPCDFKFSVTDLSAPYSGTWERFTDFPTNNQLQTGFYRLEAYQEGEMEGFVGPVFGGETVVEVRNEEATPCVVKCQVSQSLIFIEYGNCQGGEIANVRLSLHSNNGYGFHEYPHDATKPLMLIPGDVAIFANVETNDGHSQNIRVTTLNGCKAASIYRIVAEVSTEGEVPLLVVSSPILSENITIALTPELLNARAPQITPKGFDPDAITEIVEGDQKTRPISMGIEGSDIESIILTCQSTSLEGKGFPKEIDLTEATLEERQALNRLGLYWGNNEINFTKLLSNINFVYGHEVSQFTVVAVNRSGIASSPLTLKVRVASPDIEILNVGNAIMGINESAITLHSNATGLKENLSIATYDNLKGQWIPAQIVGLEDKGANVFVATVTIPEGSGDIKARIGYCEREIATVTIKRVSPEFSIRADAYARKVLLKIDAKDSHLIPIITKNVSIWEGKSAMMVYSRNTAEGIVEIIGLQPSKQYTLSATIEKNPTEADDYVASVTFETEEAALVPNGDFEETEVTINNVEIPSGGRYSQTVVDIFNQQNRKNFKILTPKKWATVNPKTFCQESSNPNTWYMQPSAAITTVTSSGNYGMEITSVGWDLDGPQIPDYTQTARPYIDYNPYVPEIAHNAAGRIWLGSYSFNPSTLEENYTEGIKFNSRPAALNGIYRCISPSSGITDQGLVKVKLWGNAGGKEVLIGEGELNLRANPDYSAFNVPIEYFQFGVKATKMTIIIASSSQLGDILHETNHVTTVPDAKTASSRGLKLWVDNLTFAY